MGGEGFVTIDGICGSSCFLAHIYCVDKIQAPVLDGEDVAACFGNAFDAGSHHLHFYRVPGAFPRRDSEIQGDIRIDAAVLDDKPYEFGRIKEL